MRRLARFAALLLLLGQAVQAWGVVRCDQSRRTSAHCEDNEHLTAAVVLAPAPDASVPSCDAGAPCRAAASAVPVSIEAAEVVVVAGSVMTGIVVSPPSFTPLLLSPPPQA